jgi:hypothetical protein
MSQTKRVFESAFIPYYTHAPVKVRKQSKVCLHKGIKMTDKKPLTGEDRLRTAIQWLSTFEICYLKYVPYQKDQKQITIIGREREVK